MPFYSIAPGCLLVEAANAAAFPATGAANTFYVALDTNALYRWSGSAYVVVSASPEEVIEAANLAAFPATGEAGKLYVAIDSGKAYRWAGSVYVEVSALPPHEHDASEVTSGTFNPARLADTGTASATTYLRGDGQWWELAAGDIGAASATHSHGGITSDGKIASGWGVLIADGVSGDISASLTPTVYSVTFASPSAGFLNIGDGGGAAWQFTGTIDFSPATVTGLPYASTTHGHDAADLTSGTIDSARLAASGIGNSSTFLRGDQAWSQISAGDISGTLDISKLPVGTTSSHVCAGNDARLSPDSILAVSINPFLLAGM